MNADDPRPPAVTIECVGEPSYEDCSCGARRMTVDAVLTDGQTILGGPAPYSYCECDEGQVIVLKGGTDGR